MVYLRDSGKSSLARLVEARVQRKFGVFVSHRAVFPRSLRLRHPVGVVIGEGVQLGERVTIYQNVTLGGARVGDMDAQNYPRVGDDTVIFAGAIIIGNVHIGRRCTIGANSVVTRDIPDDSTAVGAPARIIRTSAGPAGPLEEHQ
jgi:serine O-acetyltransferase